MFGSSFPLAALGFICLMASSTATQGEGRRKAAATRTTTPPKIDGLLDDAVWKQAQPIGELIQVVPVEGAAPSERTEVRFLYDAEAIYIAIRCFDSQPDEIITTTQLRDAFLRSDDRVELVIDTFKDRRNAFFFQMNAGGSKGDALISNNGADFNKPWNGIWEGKSNIDNEGWTAELAIPFKTLNFREGLSTWGFNMMRYIGRHLERDRWSTSSQDYRLFNIIHAGDLTGLEGMQQGIGLDVVPFFTSSIRGDREDGTGAKVDDTDAFGELGLDAFYKLTSSLNLGLTFNTDFAETEVDERQNNLTRFPLFFPEQRDFFLQDAGLFDFPGETIPFFSRRIGLTGDGQEVPILAGARLTGRAGAYNIGIVDVQTDNTTILDSSENPIGLSGQNLFAARVSKNLGKQSSIGTIVTNGDPNGVADNTVVGFDAQYRTSELDGGKNFATTAWGVMADSEGVDSSELAYGLSIAYPNDVFSWAANFAEIQENFDPALGFVRRKDIRRYSGQTSYQPRPKDSIVRQYEFSIDTDLFTTTDDVVETWELEVQPYGVEFQSGDGFRIEFQQTHDELSESFEIRDGIFIPPGDYDFTRGRLEVESSNARELSVGFNLGLGQFFDGTRERYSLFTAWRPGPLFTGEVEYSHNDIDLPGGAFTTQFGTMRANFSFTPEIAWNNFVQWDNESQEFGINSRLFWIPRPGREVFLVFNETLERETGSISPLFQELSFKIGYTVRL